MKFFFDNLILFGLAFGSGALLLWPLIKGGALGGGGDRVGTGEAVRLINREKGVLVDVSDPGEFAASHAAGARNLPLGELTGDAARKVLPGNKTLPVLLLCPTGARSLRAVALLRKAGYEKAVAVTGGTAAWREAHLPVERAADKVV